MAASCTNTTAWEVVRYRARTYKRTVRRFCVRAPAICAHFGSHSVSDYRIGVLAFLIGVRAAFEMSTGPDSTLPCSRTDSCDPRHLQRPKGGVSRGACWQSRDLRTTKRREVLALQAPRPQPCRVAVARFLVPTLRCSNPLVCAGCGCGMGVVSPRVVLVARYGT